MQRHVIVALRVEILFSWMHDAFSSRKYTKICSFVVLFIVKFLVEYVRMYRIFHFLLLWFMVLCCVVLRWYMSTALFCILEGLK